MKLTGIADEAGADIHTQMDAVQSLGWNAIELRNAAINGSTPGSIHEIPEAEFESHRRRHRRRGRGHSRHRLHHGQLGALHR